MAKKKKKKVGFNMAGEIRKLLQGDPQLAGKAVETALRKKFPGEQINSGSCGVAFSNQRKKLGLSKAMKKTVKKRRPTTDRKYRKKTGLGRNGRADVAIGLPSLQAAKELLSACGGDSSRAVDAVRQLSSLQL